MLHYLLLLVAAQAQPELPSHDTALLNAVDFCSQILDLEKGPVKMHYPGAAFMDAPPQLLDHSDKIKSVQEIPPLIRRFSRTSPSGRFGEAGFTNMSSSTGPVWVSNSLRLPFYDIAITGQESVSGASERLVASLVADQWELVRTDDGSNGAPPRPLF